MGAIAPGFSSGEIAHLNQLPDGPGPVLYAIVPVGDGSRRLYLGGIFDRYNGTPVAHLVRLTLMGQLTQPSAQRQVLLCVTCFLPRTAAAIFM